jgi:hypothetical protein
MAWCALGYGFGANCDRTDPLRSSVGYPAHGGSFPRCRLTHLHLSQAQRELEEAGIAFLNNESPDIRLRAGPVAAQGEDLRRRGQADRHCVPGTTLNRGF